VKGKKTGGRQPGSLNKNTADVRELAGQFGPAVIAELARLATEADSEQVSVSAGRELLDRGFGKPTQSRELTDIDYRADDEQVSDLEIARRVADLLTNAVDVPKLENE
jgi:hypothetical protein